MASPLLALVVACGGGDSDNGGVDSGIAGQDAQPSADAALRAERMYVHTAQELYVIDDITFEVILIGEFNAPGGQNMTDLAVTPDERIFTVSSDKLYEVDPDTAQATYVADVAGTLNVGMTFLADGMLLATDKDGAVRSVNTLTGEVQEIGAFGGSYATAGDLVAVADGRMFAISDKGPNGNEDQSNVLLTIDPSTGEYIEAIGQIGFGRVFGCAVANNKVYAFTDEGNVIEIDPVTAQGTLVKSYPQLGFWGAGVTPRARIQ
jgi:outer membrane protein assembly factor BamB